MTGGLRLQQHRDPAMPQPQRAYDPAQPLIFMHVPKCGGSSVMGVLVKWYGAGYIPCNREGFHSREDDPRCAGPSCLHGHFNRFFNQLDQAWPTRPRQLFTVLREPFDMLVSLYNFGLQGDRDTMAKSTGSIEAFLDAMLEKRGTASLFTWLPKRNEGELLADFANRFMLIGTTDQIPQTLDHLGRITGNPAVPLKIRNKSKVKSEVPDRRAEFIAAFPDEYAFYEMARDALKRGQPLGWAGAQAVPA